MASADLLTRIRAELDARLRELRPLRSEYERLLVAQAVLGAAGESSLAPTPAPTRRRGRPPGRRASIPVSPVSSERAPISTPAPVPAPRRGRPPGRPRATTDGAAERASKRSQRGAAAAAIVAALEHGSHTVSELVVVTAFSGPIIHNNLRRLRDGGTVTRTKRSGDGKSAYALA